MSRFTEGRESVKYNNLDLYQRGGLKVVDLETYVEDEFGVKRSVTFTGSTLINIEDNRFNVRLTFTRVKVGNNINSTDLIELDDDFIREISGVIYEKEVNILEYNGMIYYVVPVNGSIQKMNDIGHFTIEFESLSPYSYSPILTHFVPVDREEWIEELSNNGVNMTNADLYIECIEDGNLEINNRGNKIIVTNAKAGDVIEIMGDTNEVQTDSNCSIDYNYKTLEIMCGVNRVRVSTNSNFEVVFKFQEEYGLV